MKQKPKSAIRFHLPILLTLALCFGLRLYKINSPVGDWHSWRQADTAAVARNFIKFGFDPLHPRYDDLSNIQSGKDNPNGWRMVEYPLYQSFGYGLYSLFPGLAIEIWLRLVTIAASTGIAFLLYKLVSELADKLTGTLASFIYSVLPFSVFYGRTILPDTTMVFFVLLSLLFLLKNKDRTKSSIWRTLAAGFSAAVALLIKPTGAFLLVPAIYFFWILKEKIYLRLTALVIYATTALVPLLIWRSWIMQYPEGIPAYDWLFNKDNIRFKGAWFYWLFADRIGRLISGYWGLFFLGLGLATDSKIQGHWFFRWMIFGAIMYFVVIAGGNVQHDYYQILIIPVVSIYMAAGMNRLIRSDEFAKPAAYVTAGILFLFMISFSWYTIRTYYWINRQDLLEAGHAADTLLPSNAKVIAPNNGDTTFLYFINRQGWPQGFDIDKKIAMGATHYVTVSVENDFETKDLLEKYSPLIHNDRFAIIELQ